ncbi:DNA polymerase gamma, mitochondrial [Wickerhamiella sorbophila]|uniref:DNA polymerase gamma n=1 Tax=Wickerhamiella sorbophila TaxID=45607 RepID=A0A2T0FPA6_9ASCO|nr:DNA polymerase gamma, mitochondrial [Wickerhamiella sorbophila]PRT56815.1 DNA polymerase gamma, mitochondrial [Wickerhamiella sorbophila]
MQRGRAVRFLEPVKRATSQQVPLYSKVNPVGIYHLEKEKRDKLFGRKRSKLDTRLVDLSLEHLTRNDLLGKPTSKPDAISFELPELVGKDLDEHFQKIGQKMAEPYLGWAKEYATQELKDKPSLDELQIQSGWTEYRDGSVKEVDFPDAKCITFDTEVMYNEHEFAVLAVAASESAWYVWISPWLLEEAENPRQLIPLGTNQQVVVGYNVGYDRKRVKEEYNLEAPDRFFIDGMSLHIATNGMCSRQRPTWQKLNKAVQQAGERYEGMRSEDADDQGSSERWTANAEAAVAASEALAQELKKDPWFAQSSTNSLAEVVKFLFQEKLDKSDREVFGKASREEVRDQLKNLIHYCASDVWWTKRVFDKLLGEFLTLCPHPVSFGALRPLSQLFLPIDAKWEHFVEGTEQMYQSITSKIKSRLEELAVAQSELTENPEALEIAKQDPWLSQLDWEVAPIRMVKGKKGEPDRLAKNQKLPGKPNWFKQLYPSATKPINLSLRTRIAPILLRLKWEGHPFFWTDKYGWCFWVPPAETEKYEAQGFVIIEEFRELWIGDGKRVLVKVPHVDGPNGRCTNPMAKSYLRYFDKDIITSDKPEALEAIKGNIECSYWVSARKRIISQMPVFQSDLPMGLPGGPAVGMILPRAIPMGTVTRRAVEDTWLTASNANQSRIGSELKAMVRAPEGYAFVGADVDSEELWIASLLGDAVFGIHGGTALGWMTLEGTKSAGTDLHSRTAKILGISRNEAKVFNYGRIYGAGLNFAIRLLKQFNPSLTDSQAQLAATQLYEATKGEKFHSKKFNTKTFWTGGSESIVFNVLESMARLPRQRTPVLGAGITAALASTHLTSSSNFLTSRINWTIQSSGVDYLHLLVASMHYLCDIYHIPARLFLTVHDEIRYIVPERDTLRTALALQIANLWTRSMFCQQVGMDDIPASIAYFSLVDVDKVLRKEVDHKCITPSHPEPIDPGKAYDMTELVSLCSSLGPEDTAVKVQYQSLPSKPRQRIMDLSQEEPDVLGFVRAQIGKDEAKRMEGRSKHHDMAGSISSNRSVRGVIKT